MRAGRIQGSQRPARALARLEEATRLRPSRGRAEKAVADVLRARLSDAESVIRAHEALLFLKAYPQTPAVRRAVLRGLSRIADRVAELGRADADLSPIAEDPEYSGIGEAAVTTQFTYDLVRWLSRRFPRAVAIDWDGYEGGDRLGATWPRWIPLLEEESAADANVPYRIWSLAAGAGSEGRDLAWLLARFEELAMPPRKKAELFDGLGLFVRWRPAPRVSRTLLSRPTGRVFFQDAPLLARRDVSLAQVLSGPPLPIRRLSRKEGEQLLDMARTADAVRYRELYGFTYGDRASVVAARAGRGLEIFLNGLPRQRRLPLRAGYSAFVVKNGVPVAYVEGLAFFERIEVGFNVYSTFREGESAFVYANVLKLFQQALGSSSFSVDPYQLGDQNEEAIESGAFWFYRKLGFRSTSRALRALTAAEESRLARDPRRRTSARTLRRLAESNVLYEGQAEGSGLRDRSSPWDAFHIRRLGLAVNRRMARQFRGSAERIRAASADRVARSLGVTRNRPSQAERFAFENLALVLDLIPDLARWSRQEKDDLALVVAAKAGPDESRYLRRMQRHARLRRALLRLGSR